MRNNQPRQLKPGTIRRVIAVAVGAIVGVFAWAALAGGTQPYETYESKVTADGPAAQFRFDDAAGASNVADSAGADSATNTGIVFGGEGPFGGSKSGAFGGEAYATLPANPLEAATEFTAEAWIDWTGGTSYKQPVLDFGSSSTNYAYLTPASSLSSHKMLFEIHTSGGASAQVSATKLNANAWHYVAVTETSSGVLTMYVDGEQAGQTTGASVFPSSLGSSPTDYLGKSLIAGEPGFKGSLSNVALYTKALSASQVHTHYDDAEFPVNTVAPSLTGTAKDGNTLTAKPGTWTGLSPIGFAYQWTRCNASGEGCSNIASATGAKYTAGHEDVGSTLRVAVTASNGNGSGTATSAATAKVEALAPSNTVLPTISGEAEDGSRLSVSTGLWAGTPPFTYSYQWETCTNSGTGCKKLSGATASSYRVVSSEIGKTLKAIVTVENAGGSRNAATETTAVITAGPPVNTVLPSVVGEAKDGQLLVANGGAWAGTPTISYGYQWQHCNSSGESCTSIAGATSSTYAAGTGDIGSKIRVLVTATNAQGSVMAGSEPTALVAALPPSSTSAPTVSGTARDGQTLLATRGAWSGSAPIEYAEQWQRCDGSGTGCVDISGATGLSYVAGPADVGSTLRVKVIATNSGGSASAASSASAPTAAVAPSSTAAPVISGEARDEQALSASAGEWSGTPTITYSYQWRRCDATGEGCADISGATGSSYVVGHVDVGAELRVVVTATNAAGQVSATSAATASIVAAPPANTMSPSVSGEAKAGQTLDAETGNWIGTPAISYGYQWETCDALGEACLPIAGATEASYSLTDADIGTTIRVAVTGTNVAGQTSVGSIVTALVSGIAPSNTQPPAISGTARTGGKLVADTGMWTGSQPISYAYQWERCDGAGANCHDISGANASIYQPSAADAGSTLIVRVSAENTAGSAPASSSASALVESSECSDSWTGGAGDDLWQNAGNWSSEATPSASDRVCIPGGANVGITEGSQQAGSVSGEGGLSISGGSLELADSSQPSILGSLSLGNATLTGPGTLRVTGSMTVGSYAVMRGPGSLIVGPEANGLIEAESGCEPISLDERALVNEGTLHYAWGTLVMSDGATLQNAGTLDYDTQSSCYEPQVRVGEESTSPPAIVNTGTFVRTAGGTGGIGVAFDNSGVVEARGGRLEFSDGGVPGEVATGSWAVQEGGAIALTGGTFEIGDEVDLSQVEIAGATVERISTSGAPHGHLDAAPYASQTVMISGHGSGAGFASASIEVAPAGSGEWQALCGPLTPSLVGEFECSWDTADGSFPDGSYELRAQLSDGSTPPNTASTAAIRVLVDNSPPTGSLSAPGQLEGAQPVAGTAADSGSGVASWQLQIAPEGSAEWSNACAEQTSPASGSTYECTVDTSSYPNGTYELRTLIVDNAGNSYTTAPAGATIANEPPAVTTAPGVSGTAKKGQTLTAGTGTWSGTQPLEYAYQWQRCDDTGASCVDIAGATGTTHRIGSADVGDTLRVLVTATNSVGTASSASAATEVVSGPSCTVVWTGAGGDGSWTTAENWSTGHVPSEGDAVCVDPGTTVTITNDSNVVGTLEDEGSLVLSGGSLELADASKPSSVDSLTVRNATLTGPGSLTVDSSFAFGANATMSGTGETIVGPGVSGEIYASSGCEPMSLSERTLVNEGALTYTWGTLLMSNGARLENAGTFVYNTEASCYGTQIQPSGEGAQPAVLNTGTFEKTQGNGTSTVAVPFGNQGGVEARRGKLSFSDGGIPEETAYGSWSVTGSTSIFFDSGTFLISEDVDLSAVTNRGATVELVPDAGPPASRTAPVVSGEASVGQVLSASSGGWKGARPLSFGYQWERCEASGAICTEIPGATGATYLLTHDDYGSRLSVVVTATNSEGSAARSSQKTSVIGFPPLEVSPPTISGVAQDGQMLSASTGVWEGGTPLSYSYQWQRCTENGGGGGVDAAFRSFAAQAGSSGGFCTNISGASGSTYTLQDADVEATVQVVVTVKDADGEVAATSAQSEVVLPATAPENVALPSISGTAQEGQALEAQEGNWKSPGTITYAYQWQRCNADGEACSDIEAATAATYVPGLADLGDTLSVSVTATNGAGSTTASSQPTVAVSQAPAPTSVAAPSISGVPKDGATLSAGTGDWATPFPLTYAYQWQRCTGSNEETCADISGATSATYTLSSADPPDSAIRVVVTATNPYEASATSTSGLRFVPASVRVTEYSYDANGNLASRTDGNGHTTGYSYGPGDEQTKITHPDGSTTESGYDAQGRITTQTDANKHTTKYARNVLGQVTEVTDPLGRKTTKEHDAAGHLASVTDAASRTTTYSYDAANRLTEIGYSDGTTPNIKYEYDADGERTSMLDGTGTTGYSYDQLDRLTEAKDGHGDTTAYEYDLSGAQTKITYPSGNSVSRAYDESGRLQSVEDWLGHTTNFAYDAGSDLTRITFPGATSNVDEYGYNDVGGVSSIAMRKGTEQLASLTNTHDGSGLLASGSSTGLPGEESVNYTYDENDRLTEAGTTSYAYDAAGNPTKIAAATNSYDEANELENGTGASYAYDQVGERTSSTPTSGAATIYGHDQAGNLSSVKRAASGEVSAIDDTYASNGDGLRASQTNGGATSYLTWDTSKGPPSLLSDGADSFIYGPDGLPIEQISSGGDVLYLHHDQQGSTRLLTGPSGAVEGRATYDAYGNIVAHTGTATSPLGYDGQYTNADTGLIYLRARTYDPATGQFLSVDPLASDTLAPYMYGNDSPLNFGDPRGLWSPIGALENLSNKVGGAIAKGSETVLHVGLDIVAVPPYLVYYLSHEGARLANEAGLHEVAAGLVPFQIGGLAGDALIDWIKSHTLAEGDSICDEGFRSEVHLNPFHHWIEIPGEPVIENAPGIGPEGEVEIEW